ncbi:DUF3908 family protein [Fredinandcohnia onubensis]|uniref:DUF3908 family protein n=1 Tax=Fredinandcohnia onubensis TaxID=1571209 RepID=UPI000C0BFAE0|nr:DUF3908 family protein [Fredinandcohnia onubensis]
MSEQLYTVNDFYNDLSQRQIPLYRKWVKGLSPLLQNIVSTEEVNYFYGRNIYREGEKNLYFFYVDKIVVVTIIENVINFQTIKEDIVEANFIPSEGESSSTLVLKFTSGKAIEFNSLEDSNYNWNETYAANLLAIYKSI